jgi:hypothetical protein
MARAGLLAGGSALLAVSCSSSAYGGAILYGGVPPPCPDVTLSSPCGFVSIATTCAGSATSCDPAPPSVGAFGSTCKVTRIGADCTVTVTLGDGTSHTVPVTVGPGGGRCANMVVVVSPATPVDLASATCALPVVDAGEDSGDGG